MTRLIEAPAPGSTAPPVPLQRRRRDPWVVGSYVVVGLFLLGVLVPIVTVVVNSLKAPSDIFTDTPRLAFAPTVDNFAKVLGDLEFTEFLANSAIVALGSTALSLLVGVPAAYALARLPIPLREFWASLILFTRMVPAVALVVPMFVLFGKLELLGTYTALILAHTTFNLPIVIWMMRSFFEELPPDLEEAALVDGTGRLGAFVRIAVPLTSPGLAASAILCLLFSWNEFLFALVLSGRHTQTVPIGVASFIGTVSVDWGGSSAAAVLAMIPVFILGLAAQRFLVRGLTFGAVKG